METIIVHYGAAREVPMAAIEFARTLDQSSSLIGRIKALRKAYPMPLVAARGIFDLLKNERVGDCDLYGKHGCNFDCQACEEGLANEPTIAPATVENQLKAG